MGCTVIAYVTIRHLARLYFVAAFKNIRDPNVRIKILSNFDFEDVLRLYI